MVVCFPVSLLTRTAICLVDLQRKKVLHIDLTVIAFEETSFSGKRKEYRSQLRTAKREGGSDLKNRWL